MSQIPEQSRLNFDSPDYNVRRQSFIDTFYKLYGFNPSDEKLATFPIETLKAKEFSYLKDSVYLDHTGTTVPSQFQLHESAKVISSQAFGNPHSFHSASFRSSTQVHEMKKLALKFFNTDSTKYTAILTLNASHALEKIGTVFPWTKNSKFVYTIHNHNSVVGIRELTQPHKGQSIRLNDVNAFDEEIPEGKSSPDTHPESMFAFPAECNFSGKKYDLNYIAELQRGNVTLCHKMGIPVRRYRVLVDACAYVSHNPLDLGKYSPDFVCMSFYKMLGYPTGLGMFLLRNKVKNILNYPLYFAGGTVLLVGENAWVPNPEPSHRLEYGTQPFHTCTEVRIGLNWMLNLPKYLKIDVSKINHFNPTMVLVQRHVASLTRYVICGLQAAKHSNGAPMALVFGSHDENTLLTRESVLHQHSGAIVSFQCIGTNRKAIGRGMIDHLLSLENIQLRSGAFCNFGANALYLDLKEDVPFVAFKEMVKHQTTVSSICESYDFIGPDKPFGALRISFGYMTTFDDIDNFLQIFKNVLKDYEQVNYVPIPRSYLSNQPIATVKTIEIFPIIGCHGFFTSTWKFSGSNFLGDQSFCLVDGTGERINLTDHPVLSLLTAHISFSTENNYLLSCKFSTRENFLKIDHSFMVDGPEASPEDPDSEPIQIKQINLVGKSKLLTPDPVAPSRPKSPVFFLPKRFHKNGNSNFLAPKDPLVCEASSTSSASSSRKTSTSSLITRDVLPRHSESISDQVFTLTQKDQLPPSEDGTIRFSHKVNKWFSKVIGSSCFLVRNPKSFVPSVLLSDISAKHLIYRTPSGPDIIHSVNHDLFKSNILLESTETTPFQEDHWKNITFLNPKTCVSSTCKIAAPFNQKHLCAFNKEGSQFCEPLKTLTSFRNFEDSIHLGNTLSCSETFTISVGDVVTVNY